MAYPKNNRFTDGTVALNFNSSLYYSNTAATVHTLQADFGTGYKTISTKGAATHTYTDSTGWHLITIKAQLSNGTTQYTRMAVWVEVNPISILSYTPANLAVPDIDIAPVAGTHSGCRVFIRRSMNTPFGQIRKPLIVVEGFDINDAAPSLADNYNVNDLIRQWNSAEFDGGTYNSWLDDEAGYDLVFIDWENSTDHITRNAVLLEDVINRVNQMKAQSGSAEQNVVMGISMGGLISRYCLASMTKRNINPQTRLLITHDSPHQGAYVPLSFQHMVMGLQNTRVLSVRLGSVMGGSLDEAVTLLQTPAAQQQLSMVVTDANGTVAQNTFLSTTYRNMITFSASDPQPQYRFIATSQGSQCGIPSLPIGATLVNGSAQGNLSGAAYHLTAGIISKWKYTVDVNARGLTGNAAHQILPFRLERKQRFLQGLISNNRVIALLNRFEPAFNTIPWESVPAGTEALGERLGTGNSIGFGWSLVANWYIGLAANFTLGERFAFVPVVSALDAVTVNNTTVFGTYIRGSATSSPLRADDFIAQESFTPAGGLQQFNQPHTTFTARNSEWQYSLMENFGFVDTLCDRSCPIPQFSISGSTAICSSETYSVPLIAGAAYNWQPITSTLATITPDGNAVTVTKNGFSNGILNLSVTVTTACDTRSQSELVTITSPPEIESITIANPSAGVVGSACYTHAGNEVTITTRNPANHSNFVVTLTNLQTNTITTFNTGSTFTVPVHQAGWYTLQAQASSGCGLSDPFGFFFQAVDCTGPIFGQKTTYAYTVSPNPASNDVTVAAAASTNTKEEKVIAEINIYDQQGNLKKRQQFAKVKKATLNVSHLPYGIYLIEVSDGKTKERQQLLIQK